MQMMSLNITATLVVVLGRKRNQIHFRLVFRYAFFLFERVILRGFGQHFRHLLMSNRLAQISVIGGDFIIIVEWLFLHFF